MRVRSLETFPFALTFKQPYSMAGATLERRELIAVKMTGSDGLVGWGEAAPLLAYDQASLGTVARALNARCAPALEGAGFMNIEQAHAYLASDVPAQARAAIDIAAHDLLAKEKGVSIAQSLGRVVRSMIPVNATIAAHDPADIEEAGRAAIFAGFKTVKMKMGFPNDLDRLEALRKAVGPEIHVRLDVNGAWGVEQANACIAIVSAYNIEVLEQPVARHDIAGMHKVRSTSTIPIVADESVANAADLDRMNKANACDGVAIKISPSGGIAPASALVDYAARSGLEYYLSSALDGPIGVAAALHLAGTKPKLTKASGLATLQLFEETIADGPVEPVDGAIELPTGAGLGIKIDEDRLRELAIEAE